MRNVFIFVRSLYLSFVTLVDECDDRSAGKIFPLVLFCHWRLTVAVSLEDNTIFFTDTFFECTAQCKWSSVRQSAKIDCPEERTTCRSRSLCAFRAGRDIVSWNLYVGYSLQALRSKKSKVRPRSPFSVACAAHFNVIASADCLCHPRSGRCGCAITSWSPLVGWVITLCCTSGNLLKQITLKKMWQYILAWRTKGVRLGK